MSPGSPNILALDAAGASCSVALWSRGAVAAQRFLAMTRGQSERLVPMIGDVMAAWRSAGGGTFDDLDALAVTTGPGGFTGVRIGLATARGLALARGLPVIGVTTFEVVAAAATPAERAGRRVVAAIDSKRAAVFLQVFDSELAEAGPPAEVPMADLPGALPAGPLLLTGDAAGQVAQVLDATGRTDAVVAAAAGPADAGLLAARAALRDPAAAGPAEPVYLRPPDVTPPKAGGRQR